VKREEMTEGRKAGRASKTNPHPAPLAQSLDPPLMISVIEEILTKLPKSECESFLGDQKITKNLA